jgi:hypothetical protein
MACTLSSGMSDMPLALTSPTISTYSYRFEPDVAVLVPLKNSASDTNLHNKHQARWPSGPRRHVKVFNP